MVSFKTPDLSCLTDEDKLDVYEPAEDTFLLLDALQNDYQFINQRRYTLHFLCTSSMLGDAVIFYDMVLIGL